MERGIFKIAMVASLFCSCGVFYSLHSVTTINAHKAFVLGANKHPAYYANATNIADVPLDIYFLMNNASKQFVKTLLPGKTAQLFIEKNVALYIDNTSNQQVKVQLKTTQASSLSMTYN